MDITTRPMVDREHVAALVAGGGGVLIVRLPYAKPEEVRDMRAAIDRELREAGITEPIVMLPHGVGLEYVLREELGWMPVSEAENGC